MLIFGWCGFNPGSALLLNSPDVNMGSIASHAAVTTVLSAATGTLVSLFVNGVLCYHQTGEFVLDIVAAMNGW